MDTRQEPPKTLLILHTGCEEIEAVTPADLLRRAGFEVTLASAGSDLLVQGGRGVALKADVQVADVRAADYGLLILPGGPGTGTLRGHSGVRELVRGFHVSGKWIAAICAAPLVLLDAGILDDRSVTSFPGAAEELRGKVRAYAEDRVVVDGRVITSRGAGTAEEFSLALIALLAGDAAAEKVRRAIVAR